MCGICGVVCLHGEPVQQGLLNKMASTLAHRGPDAEGCHLWSSPRQGKVQVGLAHRRLSIIDISAGQQPLSNEDSTAWVVFNGEIYNYLEVRAELIAKGHVFRTNSDTETIVHAYEQWGQNCVEKLRGMFAFAIWDCRQEELFIARDRIGIKPLYYFWDGSTFIFGSEIKALLEHPKLTKELNLEALADFFTLFYIPSPKSIYKEVHKLEAGCTILVRSNGQISHQKYWDISFEPNYSITALEWQEQIVAKLREAVQIRLMSEVPLGAFLSGGIDSSAVVGMMAQILDDSVKTCSVGFQESAFNELEFANKVSDLFSTSHIEHIVSNDMVNSLDELVFFFDEPFADSSALPTFFVSQAARERVTVCLSGDGGDENFAGYRRYHLDYIENRIRKFLPPWFRQYGISPLAAIYPKLDWAPQFLRAKTTLTNLSLAPLESYFNTMSWFQGVRDTLFTEQVRKQIASYSPFSVFEQYAQQCPSDPLSAVQYMDMKTYLCDDILTKVDRTSMAHSLEVRVPILDHEFIELVATIPSTFKLHHGEGKYLFKKALSSFLPHDILYRKKMGFSLPLAMWFRQGELAQQFKTNVLGVRARSGEFLNRKVLENMWGSHQQGKRDWSPELWSILIFEKWLRRWC